MKFQIYERENCYLPAAIHNDFLDIQLIAENAIKQLLKDGIQDKLLEEMHGSTIDAFLESLVKILNLSKESRRMTDGIGVNKDAISLRKYNNFIKKVNSNQKANT